MPEKIDFEKFASWLKTKWQGPEAHQCPICKVNNWGLSHSLVEIREFNKEGIVPVSVVYPLISLACNNCGNTILFNAIIAKMFSPTENPSSQPSQADSPTPTPESATPSR